MNILTITGENKYVTISRSDYKQPDNFYAYYLTLFTKGINDFYFINDNYKQIEDIKSMKEAEKQAIQVLDSF